MANDCRVPCPGGGPRRAARVDEGRLLAAGLPGARFVPIPSRNHLLLESEPGWQLLLEELGEFLGWEKRAGRS